MVDRTKPTGKLLKRSCTRGSCTINIRLTDGGRGATGLRTVTAKSSTKVRRRCGSAKKRRTCLKTETKTVPIVRSGSDTFRISAKKLRRGASYTFTVRATDLANNTKILKYSARTKKK